MKDGRTPIHIMRWAPADYVNDPVVKLALSRRDFVASTFYPLFLFHAFMEGGSLPASSVLLAAIVGMKKNDVERAVAFWKEHGKLQEQEGRIFHPRVIREVAEELEFRAQQADRGRLGGRAKKGGHGGGGDGSGGEADAKHSSSPPSPAPNASASAFRQTPEQRQATGTPERVREGHELIAAVAQEANLDPSEVIRKASDWNGRGYVRLDTMSPARLDQTIVALKRWQRELRGEPEPEIPQARAAPSPKAAARADNLRAAMLGGLKGDGSISMEAVDEGRGLGEGLGRAGRSLPPARGSE